ncbi:pol poly protein [Sanghuangporus baumii]|uniref:Pol poly protein n=1 Tax=Sanghuangporus baumii TaxID=108892 RepID=A0A9Q5NF18_SANBA|nr:pol poly protein [Sanghuangporus baumii]
MEQGLSQGQKGCQWCTPVDSVMQLPKVEGKVLERRARSETEFKGTLGLHKPATLSIVQKYAQEKALNERMADPASNKSLEEMLPKQIWEFRDRFDKEAAKQLPSSSQWDMKIKLLPGAELPKPGPIYPLAPAEKRAVQEWLCKNLKKG